MRQSYVVKADTLEEARRKAREGLDPGDEIVELVVLADGKPSISKGKGESIKAAARNAKQYMGEQGVLEERVISDVKRRQITIRADDRRQAESQASKEIFSIEQLGGIKELRPRRVITPPRKGFLGIGKSPGTYEPGEYSVEFYVPAEVHVVYKRSAEINIVTTSRKGYCPQCRGALKELGVSSVSPYIVDLGCTKCDWDAPRCGSDGCGGYLQCIGEGGGVSAYKCIYCGWTGEGRSFIPRSLRRGR